MKKVVEFIKCTSYHYLCRSTLKDKNAGLIAKYDLSVEAIMVNKERTKYTLLSSIDYDACNNRYMLFCKKKSNLSD